MLHVTGLVAIIFLSTASADFSVDLCSRLRVSFSPCDQTFQILLHISPPGFQQRLTASTASKKLSYIFLHLHHSPRQPLLVRCHGCTEPARFKDSKIFRRHVKMAAIIMHLKRTCGFTETWEISWKKGTTASSTNFKLYQYSLQKLMTLAPSRKRKAETSRNKDQPFTSFHSAPPWHHHTTEGHASHWIQSPSSRPVTVEPQGAIKLTSSGRVVAQLKAIKTHHSLPEHENHWMSDIFEWWMMMEFKHWCSKKIRNRHEAPIPSCPQHLSVSSLKSIETQKTICLLNLAHL